MSSLRGRSSKGDQRRRKRKRKGSETEIEQKNSDQRHGIDLHRDGMTVVDNIVAGGS
jgi:hypothetical protein